MESWESTCMLVYAPIILLVLLYGVMFVFEKLLM